MADTSSSVPLEALESAYLLPKSIHDLLPDATAAGLCAPTKQPDAASAAATYGWLVHRATLLVWRVEDDLQASVRRLQLPAAPAGRVFVSVLPHRGSAALTVLLVTSDGLVCAWLDAHYYAPPITRQLAVAGVALGGAPAVTAVAAGAADAPGALGFAAVVATGDGGLHLLHGGPQGVFPRQFHRPHSGGAGGAGAGGAGGADGGGGAAGADGVGGSLLGAIGGAVRALYSEAFDPLYRVARPHASRQPARALALLPAAAGAASWRLLALAGDALDCWSLGAANAAAAADDRLLWSFNLPGAVADELGGASSVEPLALAPADWHSGVGSGGSTGGSSAQQQQQQRDAAAGYRVVVWSGHTASNALAPAHALSVFHLRADSLPQHEATVSVTGAAGAALPAPAPGGTGWRVAARAGAPAVLAAAPNGAVVEWLPGGGASGGGAGAFKVLASARDNLDAAPAPARMWQVLNARYGVLLLASSSVAGGAGASVSGRTVAEVLEASVALMARECAAGCPYAELASGLGARLERLGLFSGGAAAAGAVVGYSAGVVDETPKDGAAGAQGAPALAEQLSRKGLRHDMLLAALDAGGALPRLPSGAVAAVLAHAEQLAAAGGVFELLPELGAAAADGTPGAADARAAAAAALEAAGGMVAGAAGGAAAAAAGAAAAWAPFFARPTAGAPALLRAVANAAAELRGSLEGPAAAAPNAGGAASAAFVSADTAAARLTGLGLLLTRAASAAEAKRAQLAAAFPRAGRSSAGSAGSWLAGAGARAAWAELAHAALLLKPRLPRLADRLRIDEAVHLPAAAALLRTAAGAGSAADSAGTTPSATARGGGGARAEAELHAASLLADAKDELDELKAAGALPPRDDATAAAAAAALVWRVEALAAEGGAHAALFDVAELLLASGLDDAGRLARHMRGGGGGGDGSAAAGGGGGSFAEYAMGRLRQEGRVRELLSLGRDGFGSELLERLAPFPSLLWLAQANAGKWSDAAAALLTAAQAQKTVSARRGALGLAKLAARAAAPALDADAAGRPRGIADAAAARNAAAKRAAGGLQALLAQEALGLAGANGGAAPMAADELLRAVLGESSGGGKKGGGGSGGSDADPARVIAALSALAAAPAELRDAAAPLWQAAWQRLLDATDCAGLAALRQSELDAGGGTADNAESFADALAASPLCAGLVAVASALLACSPAGAPPRPAEALDALGEMLRARAAAGGGGSAAAVVEAAVEAAARESASALMAAADDA